MKRQRKSEDGREIDAGRSQDVPGGFWRRRARRLLILGAVAALAAAFVLVALRFYRARPPRSGALAETAIHASPEAADVLREASEVVDRLVERFPDSPDALEVMVRLHSRFGGAQEAVNWCERCLELDPKFHVAYAWMGVIARQKGDLAKAAECFRKTIELDPGSPGVYAELGDVLMKQDDLNEAVAVLQKSREVHPRFAPSLARLGDVYVRRKEYEKARATLEAAIAIAPDFTNAYYGLATSCGKLGDETKSKEYLERFKALRARDEREHRDRLKSFDGLADVRRDLAEIYTAAAKVYLAHGEPQPAEEHLLKASQLDRSHVESARVLAWLYEQEGRTDDALKTLTELSKRVPQNLGVHVSLGALHGRLRQFDLAEQAFQKAIELTPRHPEPYAALVELYLQADRNLPEAKILALKAVDREPSAVYYSLLSAACQRTGDLAGARSAIQRAVALDPQNAELQRAYEMVRGSKGR